MRLRALAVGLGLLSTQPAMADDRSDRLEANVLRLGDVRPELVGDAVEAALAAETEAWPAEFLLGLAYQESRLEPTNQTGRVCGAMQVAPMYLPENIRACGGGRVASWDCQRRVHDRCRMWARDTMLAFQDGVAELDAWLAVTHGDRTMALVGRACGYTGGRIRRCGKAWFIANVRCSEARIRMGRPVCRYHSPPRS